MTLRAAGELDLAGVDMLERAVGRASDSSATLIVLDLSRLEFIDSAGVSLLLRLDATSRANGDRLRLVRGSRAVQRVLEVTGADGRLSYTSPHPG